MTVQERQQVQAAYRATKVTHERAFVERRAAERASWAAEQISERAPDRAEKIAAARRELRAAQQAEEAALQEYTQAHKAEMSAEIDVPIWDERR